MCIALTDDGEGEDWGRCAGSGEGRFAEKVLTMMLKCRKATSVSMVDDERPLESMLRAV